MNKRLMKKKDKKLYKAIKELNEDVGYYEISHEEILKALFKVKRIKGATENVFNDYYKFIIRK